ncbi:TetR/AcrR family transcriptional regulator [Parafrigoribacterium mesophilum]|uniref:TetR/AcrR family transcriptional regulator n=1 Tax=Parafrigoribacterium mesophilum TaxID=433646 RepID=UPI0031FDEFB2
MSDATVLPAGTPAARRYHSTLRSEQAAQTRQRILDAAAECFSAQGYAGTSLGDIAKGAGVSVETVKLNGPKRQLLLSSFERAFAGTEGTESVADREEGRAILELEDNDRFLEAVVRFIAEATLRTNALWASFLSAATSDPIIARSFEELLERRLGDFRMTIDVFEQRGMLLSQADRTELADALSFLMSPESYTQLVERAGWSHERYVAWMLDAISRLILAA